ncbi:hypothetical protein GTP46_10850 [Duganella sp. FT135W]|uniref:Pilus assembly protein n=1 Tax=Duganella flavida TaxID=2692175 RepID=A0A6L8K6M5_9BURK|nr:hypothetical protein [Duganella flavida]MYM23143.1 hypothetical protein [Duganella flavida]
MRTTILLAAVLPVLLSACGTTPRLDREFGNSLRLARAQQTLDPQAGRVRRPVNGMDAQAATAAYQNYQQSFTTKDDQSGGFTIGVGGKR